MKTIFHLDLDAFFASVEQANNPKLKNKPIIVGGRTRNSVVSSANYLARLFGITSAMPVFMAKEKCPQLVVVNGNYGLYEEYSQKFFQLLRRCFTNQIQEASIDECYMDATKILPKHRNNTIVLAKKIQNIVKENLAITVSIGVSDNCFFAKMATKLKTPNSIIQINQKNYKEKLWPLSIDKMIFVGKKTTPKLKAIGINTIGELANYQDEKKLSDALGSDWKQHWLNANGKGSDFVDTSKNLPKSLSISHTLLEPSNDQDELISYLKYMCEELAEKLKLYEMKTKTVGIIYKNKKAISFTRHYSISHFIDSYVDIYKYSLILFEQNFNNEEWKLIGVSVSNLITSSNEDKPTIFNFTNKKNILRDIVQDVNKQLKKELVFIAKDKI